MKKIVLKLQYWILSILSRRLHKIQKYINIYILLKRINFTVNIEKDILFIFSGTVEPLIKRAGIYEGISLSRWKKQGKFSKWLFKVCNIIDSKAWDIKGKLTKISTTKFVEVSKVLTKGKY
jgi:hypothetical protein